ncbi:hypothetical protein HZS_4337 [Henneguya salminicola]|nr:hypothetical protein HZS_4337 [Henneguya salminicola]
MNAIFLFKPHIPLSKRHFISINLLSFLNRYISTIAINASRLIVEQKETNNCHARVFLLKRFEY